MPRKKKAKPELRVVFDTNVLFTQVVYDLVRSEVKRVIEENSTHADLSIKWYLPGVVIGERRYQMRSKAFELLPSITKLERLLGHNLNITKDILTQRVNAAIDKQLRELAISTIDIDTAKVDWRALIDRAVYRHPPFQAGDNEKGFRDSLIAEAFLQLVEQSPNTPSVCRLAVVTNDELLTEFVKESTKDTKNVRVLSTISDLESLINTLVSAVTEEFVADMQDKAEKLFFEKENDTGLYYKEKIREKIGQSYGNELEAVPESGLLRENGTWWISGPVFVRKERQRIFWITPIEVDASIYKWEWPKTTIPAVTASTLIGAQTVTATPTATTIPSSLDLSKLFRSDPSATPSLLNLSPSGEVPKKIEVITGQSKFEVHWSVNVSQVKRLTSARVDKVEYKSTKWGER